MAALTAARATPSRGELRRRRYKMAGATTVYAGGMVMVQADGYAAPAAASASNKGVVGVATETVVNAGADGAAWVEVAEGEFQFAADTIAIASLAGAVYADDDQTIDETQATNCPKAGVLIEVVSASVAWVHVGATIAASI